MIIEESVIIYADLMKVWNTISDRTCWKEWNKVIEDKTIEPEKSMTEGESLFFCIRPFSIPISFEPEIQEVVPGKRLVWTGFKYGISARHEFLFQQLEKGIKVTSRETFTGILVGLEGLFFPKRKIREMTISLLESLKEAAEAH